MLPGMFARMGQGHREISEARKAVKLIRDAKLKCQNWIEKSMMTGKTNPVAAIFNLKNNYRWKDKTELDATTNGKDLQAVPIVINMPKQDGNE